VGRKYLRGYEDGFEWRGKEVSRLEGLSDAVFGFAITLLVVSLEVPQSVGELLHAMRGFVGFAVSFALLFRLWAYQYRFFRRYGLEDELTIRLNGVLLFVVLFFIYPLKFLTSAVTNFVMDGGLHRLKPGALTAAMANGGFRLILIFYVGFGTVFLVLGLMYYHAYRMRDHIGLNALESLDTRITCERLVLPLPIFPVAIALLGIDLPSLAPDKKGQTIVAVLAGEVLIFAYLAWAVWRVRQLKKQRAAVVAAMDHEGAGIAVVAEPIVP
jgi:hypothetical protein